MIKTKSSPDWRGMAAALMRIVLTGVVALLAVWVMSLSYHLVTLPTT